MLHRTTFIALLIGCAHEVGASPEEPDRAASGSPRAGESSATLREGSRRFVEVRDVAPLEEELELRLPARVVFREEAIVRIGAPVAGRVTEVHVSVGDPVAVGQALMTMSSPEVAAVRSSLASASATLRAARRTLDRVREMMDQGVGTEREVIEAEAHLAEVEAEVARGRATAALIRRGDGATLVLRSPLAGVVLSRSATVGAAVASGDASLVEVGDPARSWIEADLDERDLALVTEGQRVHVDFVAHAQGLEGTVVRVGATVDPVTRAAPVRIALTRPSPAFRPGMIAWARVGISEAGITVPTRSVLVLEGRSDSPSCVGQRSNSWTSPLLSP